MEIEEVEGVAEVMWHSPLLQAVATMMGNGQVYCGEECRRMYYLLHRWDPNTRSEVEIIKNLISAAGGDTTSTVSSPPSMDPSQMSLPIPGLEL